MANSAKEVGSSTSPEGEPAKEHTVNLHTHIGNRPGVIVELREADWDIVSERDMTHLRESDARELYEQLDKHFGGE